MRNKKKKEEPERICYICGKTIVDENPEYIKTRRGTEIFLHKGCVPGRRSNAAYHR